MRQCQKVVAIDKSNFLSYAVSNLIIHVMAYGSREPVSSIEVPAVPMPDRVITPVEAEPLEDSDRDEDKGRKGGKDAKQKKRNQELILIGREVERKRAAEKAAALAHSASESTESVTASPESDLVDVKDVSDLEDLSDDDEGDEDKGLLHDVGRFAGGVAGTAAVAGVTGITRFGAVQTLTFVDRLALKLNSWGDKLLKKADLPFPFGTVASMTAGGLDWIVGKLASEKSLAELIKKESEEKKKAEEKALKQLIDDRNKTEKKKDDEAKKAKKKKEDAAKKERQKKDREAKQRRNLKNQGYTKDEIDAWMLGMEFEDLIEEEDEEGKKAGEEKTDEEKTEAAEEKADAAA